MAHLADLADLAVQKIRDPDGITEHLVQDFSIVVFSETEGPKNHRSRHGIRRRRRRLGKTDRRFSAPVFTSMRNPLMRS